MQALSERLHALLAGAVLERADLLGFSSLKTYAPTPDSLQGRRLVSVGRRAKYLVWTFDDGNRIVLHLSQAGRLDVEEPPKKTKPRGSVARFTFTTAGDDAATVAVLVREHGTQRKASWWVLPRRRRRPAGRARARAGQRRAFAAFIRTSESNRHLTTDPPRPARRLGHRPGVGRRRLLFHRAKLSPFAFAALAQPRTARGTCWPRRPTSSPTPSSSSAPGRAGSPRPSSAAASACTTASAGPAPRPGARPPSARVSFESYEMILLPGVPDGGQGAGRPPPCSRLLK